MLTHGRRCAAGWLSATFAVLLATLAAAPAAHAASSLTVDVTRQQQIINGFGVNANVHSWDGGELRPAIDAIAAMGATTWRVIVDRADWEATNDNADPLIVQLETLTAASTSAARWLTCGTPSRPSRASPGRS